MGLLDDAIRQHLELKRRAGADPSDVAKLEREAFGPIEHGEALAVPEDPAAHETALAEEAAYEEAELEAEEEWSGSHPVAAAESAPQVRERAAPPEPDVPEVRERAAPQEPVTAREPVAPPEPAAPPVAPGPPAAREPEPEPLRAGGSIPLDDVGERTVEFSSLGDPEPDPQPDAEPGEHDELEETPEFLQETPEHDRLWFEQKPPRDFDF